MEKLSSTTYRTSVKHLTSTFHSTKNICVYTSEPVDQKDTILETTTHTKLSNLDKISQLLNWSLVKTASVIQLHLILLESWDHPTESDPSSNLSTAGDKVIPYEAFHV